MRFRYDFLTLFLIQLSNKIILCPNYSMFRILQVRIKESLLTVKFRLYALAFAADLKFREFRRGLITEINKNAFKKTFLEIIKNKFNLEGFYQDKYVKNLFFYQLTND